MLNIGRLGTDLDAVVEYYTANVDAEIATHETQTSTASTASAQSKYYLDKQNPDRWVGALRAELGVDGGVDADAFRRMLEGCHPLTGEPLTHGARTARNKQQRHQRRRSRSKSTLNVNEVAQRLDLNTRHVRRLLERGAALGDDVPEGAWSFLHGTKVQKNLTGPGRAVWQIPVSEVERFEQARESASMRPGFDLTLRPPKSVSIVWALGKTEWSQIVANAHREAVDEVVNYYESAAIFSRKRVEGDQLRIETGGLIGAAFDHRTSRAGDPLLHTHVVVFNATRCVDGEWRSLDGTPIYEHAKTAGYLYQAHLRHVLSRELGVRWTEVVNGCAEIDGIPQAIIDLFSKRRDEIECAVAESGYTSPGAHQAANLATRRPKGREPEPPVAIARWWDEARALGFTDNALAACVNRAVEVTEDAAVPFVERLNDAFEELIGPDGLTLMMSSFARRDVIRELAERAVDECSAQQLREYAEQFVDNAGAVRLNVTGKDADVALTVNDAPTTASSVTRFSTPELLGKESDVLSWADKAFSGAGAVAPTDIVESAIVRHRELTDEQISLVRSVTRNGDRLHLIVGDPGSGKTYGMRVAVDAFVAAGVPVIGAALSADAGSELELSVELGRQTGRAAGTITRLLDELDDAQGGGFAFGTVLILDEASMVGTRMLHRLIEHLDKANGTLVMLGDPSQHGSVETGGVYRHLTQVHAKRVVRLRANKRQTDEAERKAIAEYRDGQIRKALDIYDGAGKIVRSKTLDESYDAMVRDWYADWSSGERSPMLAGRNAMRAALNARARAALLASGSLSEQSITINDREFRVGDWVVARRNKHRLRGATNTYVKNGSIGTITEIDIERRSVTVEFEREGAIRLPDWYLDEDNLDHAYARTTYGVQGKTLERGNYQPTDVSSFEEGYVATTRARSGTRIYIVDEGPHADSSKPACTDYNDEWVLDGELVAKALEKRRAKIMAHELDSPEVDV